MHITFEYLILYLFTLGYLLCIKEIRKSYIKCEYLETIIIIVCSIHLTYVFIVYNDNICEFNTNCYGIEDNSMGDNVLYSDRVTYETYNECSTSITFGDDIMNYDRERNYDCDKTQYGCCKLENSCQTAIEYNMTYEKYDRIYTNTNRGIYNTFITQKTENGKDCPTHNDIFNYRENTEKILPFIIYFTLLCIYTLMHIIICLYVYCFNKEEKKNDFQKLSASI
jgi:hypothetical protein